MTTTLLNIMFVSIHIIITQSSCFARVDIRLLNNTPRDAEFWIDNKHVATVPKASRTVICSLSRESPNQGVGDLTVVVVSEGGDGYWLNAVKVTLTTSPNDRVDVVWGGIDPDETLAAVALASAGEPKWHDLAKERWATISQLAAGRPSPMSATLIGMKWRGKDVRGEVLAINTSKHACFTNSIGMHFVRINAGSFNVAQVGGAAGRGVTLSQNYYIATTEATNAQVAMGLGKAHTRFETADRPRSLISWYKATEFCAALNDVPGYVYRLPTEAQWEFACRAGGSGPFDPAVSNPNLIMWSSRNSNGAAHPVGQLLPNAFGLFDMHGNVREWCRDWWSFTPSVGTDPIGPLTGTEKVRRGGSFDRHPGMCTSGLRDAGIPEDPWPAEGFRPIVELAAATNKPNAPLGPR